MHGELHSFLTEDHERLDALLTACRERVDPRKYTEFRAGLLRHIGIEESVLFPLLRAAKGTTELEPQLHRDHAAIAALLVPPPSSFELDQIAEILAVHNVLEEQPGGLYDVIDQLASTEIDALMVKVHAIPQIPLAPHSDTPLLRQTIETLLRDADEGRRRLLQSATRSAPRS